MSDLNVALVLRLIDRVTGPSKRVLAAMRDVGGAVDGTGQGMIARGRQITEMVELQRQKLGQSAVATAAWAGGAGFAFKTLFLDTAAEFERYRTVLETVAGSAGKAAASMTWVSDFAAKTPYDLASVTEAFVQLRSYGLDPTSGLMATLGDTAAAMGKPVMQAVEAIADAVTGENERLKEFGITAAIEGTQVIYSYTNKAGEQMTAAVDKSNRAQIQSTLQAIWNEKYGGAMEKLSTTWDGMISNLGDQWTRFATMVMEAGVFEALKGQLAGLLDQVNAAAADGSLQEWAQGIADAMLQFGSALGLVGRGLIAVAQAVAPLLQPMRDWAAANPALAASLGQIAAYLLAARVGMLAFRLAAIGLLQPLGAVLRIGGLLLRAFGLIATLSPFTALIAGAAALAYAIYENWDNIGAYFRDKCAAVAAAFAEGWTNGVVALIAEFNPVTLVSEAMAGLGAYLAEKLAELAQTIHQALSGIDLYDAGIAMIASLWEGAKGMVAQMVADLRAKIASILPDWALRFLPGAGEAPAAEAVAAPRAPITPAQLGRGGDVTVNQTVNAAPGMDERRLADEAARRAGAAVQRGSARRQPLYDQGDDELQ